MTNYFAYCIVELEVTEIKKYYIITSLLSPLFDMATWCTMFYVFYTIIDIFRGRFKSANTRVSSTVKYVHWVIVGLFAALLVVDWSWLIAETNDIVHDEFSFVRKFHIYEKIDSARCILYWLGALEVLGWAFYLGLKTSRDPSSVKIKVRRTRISKNKSPFPKAEIANRI